MHPFSDADSFNWTLQPSSVCLKATQSSALLTSQGGPLRLSELASQLLKAF